jgi:MarR family transcriptional regulator, organic hydroperoxide resistance regulator
MYIPIISGEIIMQLHTTLGYQLIQLMHAHRLLADRALNIIGVYAGQELLLLHLAEHDAQRPTELALLMDVEPPTITRMIQRMESSGLVERHADPQDRRAALICLTERGRELIQPIQCIWHKLETATRSNLTAEESIQLSELLERVTANLKHLDTIERCP